MHTPKPVLEVVNERHRSVAEQESAPSTVQSFAHCFGDVVETPVAMHR